jgi:hypothetical protein
MQALLKKDVFEFTINKAFKEVIHNCKQTKRQGQGGTWITDEVEKAYCKMHKLGMRIVPKHGRMEISWRTLRNSNLVKCSLEKVCLAQQPMQASLHLSIM